MLAVGDDASASRNELKIMVPITTSLRAPTGRGNPYSPVGNAYMHSVRTERIYPLPTKKNPACFVKAGWASYIIRHFAFQGADCHGHECPRNDVED